MADESEKKPKFVLNKKEKKPETASTAKVAATPERKKVVVIKRKAPVSKEQEDDKASEQKKEPVRIVAKTTSVSSEHTDETTKPVVEAPQKPVAKQEDDGAAADKAHVAVKQHAPFELNSARPNVKAGNLSGSPRGGSNGAPRGRYGQGQSNGGQYNNGPRREGGLTGAQAREGYQNREREVQNGQRSGGYQGGGYQGGQRSGGYQGGQRSGGDRGGGCQGGERCGGYQGGRPGFGGRPAGGGFGGGRGGFNEPAPMEGNKTPAKKAFKGKKQVYSRKDKEESFDEEQLLMRKKDATPASVVPTKIDIMETISVSDLAKKMNLKASEIIGKLMSMGMMVTINQTIDSDTATIVASEYNCEVHLVSLYDETVIESDKGEDTGLLPRPPIVTVR